MYLNLFESNNVNRSIINGGAVSKNIAGLHLFYNPLLISIVCIFSLKGNENFEIVNLALKSNNFQKSNLF